MRSRSRFPSESPADADSTFASISFCATPTPAMYAAKSLWPQPDLRVRRSRRRRCAHSARPYVGRRTTARSRGGRPGSSCRRSSPRGRAGTALPLQRAALDAHRCHRRSHGSRAGLPNAEIERIASRRCSTISASSPCPECILEKPGPLNADEWLSVVQHLAPATPSWSAWRPSGTPEQSFSITTSTTRATATRTGCAVPTFRSVRGS